MIKRILLAAVYAYLLGVGVSTLINWELPALYMGDWEKPTRALFMLWWLMIWLGIETFRGPHNDT